MSGVSEHGGPFDDGAPDLSIGQAAVRSGFSPRAIQRAIQAGQLPVREVAAPSGRQYVVRPDDLDHFAGRAPGAAAVPPASPPPPTAVNRRRGAPWPLIAVIGAIILLLVVFGLSRLFGSDGRQAGALPPFTPTPRPIAAATATAGAACAGSACSAHPTVPPSSATTSNSFMIVVDKRDHHGQIEIRGQMTLREGMAPSIKRIYLGCRPASRRAPGSPPSVSAPSTRNTVRVDATGPLPPATIARLQRWAAAYAVLLTSDDPRVTDVVTDDPHEDAEADGAGFFRQLRAALGPSYVVRSLHAVRDNSLTVQPGERCP